MTPFSWSLSETFSVDRSVFRVGEMVHTRPQIFRSERWSLQRSIRFMEICSKDERARRSPTGRADDFAACCEG